MIAVPQYPPEAYQDGVLFFVRDGQVMPWAPPAIRAKFAAPPQDVPKPAKPVEWAKRPPRIASPIVKQKLTAARDRKNRKTSDERQQRIRKACGMANSGKTVPEIAQSLGVKCNTVYGYLVQGQSRAPRSNRTVPAPIGEVFGSLRVVREIKHDRYGNRMMECICDCGKPATAQLSGLRSGVRVSCGHLLQLPSYTEEQRARVVELRASGMSHRKIAEAVGMSKSNVAYILAPRKGANA